MKIALDENLPPAAGKIIKALLENGRIGTVQVVSARDYADPPARSEIPWLKKFKDDNGEVVITGDRKIRAKPHERKAVIELGLIVFFVPKGWSKWRFMNQCSFLLRWWPAIVEKATTASPGSCFDLPGTWNPHPDKIENVTGPKKTK